MVKPVSAEQCMIDSFLTLSKLSVRTFRYAGSSSYGCLDKITLELSTLIQNSVFTVLKWPFL